MPQKKIKKTPYIILSCLILLVVFSLSLVFTLFKDYSTTLTSAAGIEQNLIEYASIRVFDNKGGSYVRKISSIDEINKLYNSLEDISVKKHFSAGSKSTNTQSCIYLKLKNQNGLTRLTPSQNSFKSQNSSILSPFVMCYYDITDTAEFNDLLNALSA